MQELQVLQVSEHVEETPLSAHLLCVDLFDTHIQSLIINLPSFFILIRKDESVQLVDVGGVGVAFGAAVGVVVGEAVLEDLCG